MLASRFAFALVAVALALPGAAQVQTDQAEDTYKPTIGQAGKDVVWVPTPDALVIRMLEAVKTTKDDIVYDLGSGDGKIPIAAAKQYGAKATGIEYNPEMAEFARRNVKRAGVEHARQHHHRRHLRRGFLQGDRGDDVPAAAAQRQASARSFSG